MAKSNKSMKFYESIIKDNTWSVNVLLKAEIDGCNLNESSKSFQIHRPIGERSLPRSCFEKWDFEAVIVARQTCCEYIFVCNKLEQRAPGARLLAHKL